MSAPRAGLDSRMESRRVSHWCLEIGASWDLELGAWILMSWALVRVTVRGIVRGEDHFVRAQGVGEAGQRHLLSQSERTEERFELRLVGVVRDIAGVEKLHGKLAPFGLVQAAEPG